MMIFLKKLVLVPLLLAGMMNAFAYPGNSQEADARRQEWAQSSEARRDNDERWQRDSERRGGRDARQYADGQYPPNRFPPSQGADDGRRGKMSPEERKALRRQIDEAGRDIYAPRR
ncbi:MAG: hypothetical protein HYS18_08905 [Burkholderiales bacterium]|nr:hypothetical protein [Burkholderiales bacterium]